ncbi:MAG: hypothetical protein GY953_33045, partial [bacterium]|nr:hypothetical protein [bacterium]
YPLFTPWFTTLTLMGEILPTVSKGPAIWPVPGRLVRTIIKTAPMAAAVSSFAVKERVGIVGFAAGLD